jgi:uncharacterized membrane protein
MPYSMSSDDKKGRLVLAFFVFALLLNFPFLAIIDQKKSVGLYYYFFAVWLVLIVVVAWILQYRRHR